MKITVRHVTRYSFDKPVRAVAHALRLFPVNTAGQTVTSWNVAIEGASFGALFRDGAGDMVRAATIGGPVAAYDVEVTGLVSTTDTAGILRKHAETTPPLAYLRGGSLTEPDGALRKLADKGKGSGLDLAHDLARLVHEALGYQPGVTTAETTAAQALKLGQGVCQDFTHLVIALAQIRQLPARYVTGYLAPREGVPALQASHAWAEIHVEGLGWVGFDAANACCPDDHYIRVGSGRDAVEAAPIRGAFRGLALHAMDIDVSVVQATQQSQN